MSNEEISGLCGNLTQYKIAPYPGIDTIEIEGAKVSEIEHWPNDTGSGEYFKHKLIIGSFCMIFTYRIDDKRVLLEYCMVQDIKSEFWINMNWENIKPFGFSHSSDIVQYLPYKNWEEYFSVEAIKNYVISHRADENFLTKDGMFY